MPTPDLPALTQRTGLPAAVLEAICRAGRRYALRVVLYGSRARGDYRPRSDIDIAFFGSAQDFPAFADAMDALPTLLEVDCVHVTPSTSAAFAQNIRKDGITLMDTSCKKAAQLASAVDRLAEAVAEYRQTGSKTVRDGVIQRFEFCAELAWKAARDHLMAQGYLDVNSPKAVLRKAYAEGLVTDEQAWITLLDARNQTSHLYDDALIDRVYQAVEDSYLTLLRQLAARLQAAP